MTFVAVNLLSISINVLLLIFVFICLLMTLLILMQRPKQEGLGAAFGGGVTDQVFGARTTNVLQKGTVYLGSLFFILSLLLSVLIGQQNKTAKVVTDEDLAPKVEETKPATPAVEVTPKSLSDELPAEESAPTPPPADSTEITLPVPPADAAPAIPTPVEPPAPVSPGIETAPPADASSTPADKPKEP